MATTVGKHTIEFNVVGDGREFLNFWDWAHGNDVVCEIIDNRLWYTPPGEELPHTIGFAQFLNLVRESVQKRTI
jgi:hypothetical protein